MTIVNQNGESSKSTKRKTTDHQQEKKKNTKRIEQEFFYRNGQSVGNRMVCKIKIKIGQVDSDLDE